LVKNILGLNEINDISFGSSSQNLIQSFSLLLLPAFIHLKLIVFWYCYDYTVSSYICWVDVKLSNLREIKEILECLGWETVQENCLRLSIFVSDDWHGTFGNFIKYLELLLSNWHICDDYLTSIYLIDDIFFHVFLKFQGLIIFWKFVSILGVIKSLSNENFVLNIASFFNNFLVKNDHSGSSHDFKLLSFSRIVFMIFRGKWNSYERKHSNHFSVVRVTVNKFIRQKWFVIYSSIYYMLS